MVNKQQYKNMLVCLQQANSLSEHPVICVMKGWVLLNNTALEHRGLLVRQQFSRDGTMVLSYKPHTYNFLFIISLVEERTEGL